MFRIFVFATLLSIASLAAAQSGVRSYVYTGVVQPFECDKLPQKAFEIAPALERSSSDDRLQVKCQKTEDGELLLSLTFQLTDAPPPLERGQSRRYSFRWGAKVGGAKTSSTGEFTKDRARCTEILNIMARAASAKDPRIEPSWQGSCVHEDRWGTVMEINLTESLR